LVAIRRGDSQQAETFLLEGLARAQDSGKRRWSRWYLVGLAEIARLRGMGPRAAKLIGASEGTLSTAGTHYEPATHDEIERIIAAVRAELDGEVFERLSAEGRAMSPKEAIACAFEPISDGLTERDLITGGVAIEPGVAAESQGPYPNDLTEREVEVLRLITAGKSNQEIGQELILSRRTVERHISNIYQKIGASGKVARATATAYALRHGLAT